MVNEMLLPSTLPSEIFTSPPSGPMVEPFRVAPSALKVKATGTSPLGVFMVPVHFPSTSCAKATPAQSSRPRAIPRRFISSPLQELRQLDPCYDESRPNLLTISPHFCGISLQLPSRKPGAPDLDICAGLGGIRGRDPGHGGGEPDRPPDCPVHSRTGADSPGRRAACWRSAPIASEFSISARLSRN